jgi:hypothetical protein
LGADAAVTVQPLNLLDFTGGLNMRDTDFMLQDNESPGMLNINMDTRGGIVTRAGWAGWNANDVIADPTHSNWKPRNAEMHLYSTGSFAVFITNGTKVWTCQQGQNFVDMGITANAVPHLADFAMWGDTVYIATGKANQAAKVTGLPAAGNMATLLAKLVIGTNDDNNYTDDVPNAGVFPACDLAEAHGGYMFAASTIEGANTYPNRLRWSHPDMPENWAKDDYIDILQGGSRITALKSFRDHLLIFKVDSVWALYGYDRDSWQLIKVSTAIGTPGIQAVTKSDQAVYFYSASSRNGVYAYHGQDPVLISEPIKRVMDLITVDNDVWLGWQNKRLLCSTPFDPLPEFGSHGSILLFDPEVGNGAWIRYKPAKGTIACVVERSDVGTELPMLVTCGCTGYAGIMRGMASPTLASDVFKPGTTALGFRNYYRTSWKHAGWPELQKSWLRPRVITRKPPSNITIRMNTFWNYDSDAVQRSHVFDAPAGSGAFWRLLGAADPLGGGFDWGDGTLWGGGGSIGDVLVRPTAPAAAARGGSLGWARAVMLEFLPEDYTKGLAWAVDAIVLKYNMRRFTT